MGFPEAVTTAKIVVVLLLRCAWYPAFTGVPDVDAKINFPRQHVFSVTSPKTLYSWLLADDGLMSLLASAPTSAFPDEVAPQIALPNGRSFMLS